MLKKHSHLMVSLVFILDLVLTSLALIAAYIFRFSNILIPVTKGTPDYKEYLKIMPLILIICMVTYRFCGLYRPRRVGTLREEWFDIIKATLISSIAFAAATFFYRTHYEYSRTTLGVFFFLNCLFLGFSRSSVRLFLRFLRKRGWNLRYAYIVGSGKLAQSFAYKIAKNPWTGVQILGFIDSNKQRVGKKIGNHLVIGHISDLPRLIPQNGVDQVYIAFSWDKSGCIENIIQTLSREIVDIRIVPDLLGRMTLRSSVSTLDGLPILTIQESPLIGWNFLLKRVIDISASLFFLIALLPLLLAIALLIKLTSKGAIFYKQERMSLDGRTFQIFKFRTMYENAEEESGATWAFENDPRRTWIGAILRKTSLDELPQFFNVLKGDMSIVGPRPERPVLIEGFKKKIPKYMLRHKIKAGITGWAQVNGWRGNTSLKKRIQYDLYYIQNWSLWFDFQIMFLTFLRGLINKNAL